MSGSLLQAIANPPNPLAQVQQSAGGINALMDMASKKATANAYQQAIDPTTGQLDQGKFNALMASTPQGAWNIGPTMQQAGQAQSAQGVGTQQQIAAARAQLSGIAGYMQPLLNKTLNNQTVSGQEVLNTMQQAQAAGLVTPQMAANIQKQVASIGNGDAGSLVRGAYFATMTGQQQLQTLAPPAQPLNIGAAVVPWQGSPLALGGVGVTGGRVASMGVSPETATQPIEIWQQGPAGADGIPTWKKVIVPRAQVTGTGMPAGGEAPGSPYPAGYTGRPAPAQPAPGTTGTTQPPSGAVQPPATIPATPPLAAPPIGAPEAVLVNQQRYQADASNIPVHQSNVVNLQHAYEALQQANTGPGTDRTHQAYAFLQAQGISNIPGLTSDTPENISNWAIARKALTAYAASQAGAAGSTDLQSQLNQLSNASVDIPNDAARTITRQNIGLERMRMAQVHTAPDSSGAGYIGHTTTFTPSQDMRAYYADMMTPAEFRSIQSNKSQWTKFRNSLKIATDHGYFTLNQIPGGPGYVPPPGTPALSAPASSGPQVPTGP